MNIVYDRYNQPIQSHVYLGTPNNKILCAINGIEESTFQLTQKFINTYELTFDINENILIEDEHGLSKLVHSNVYDLVAWLMRVYVDNVGWFIMDAPKISHDGIKETKTITCHSAEIEMEQHDLKNFKINQGTTDSYEMLADNNVEKIDDVEFAKEQIKFYNPNNPQLSLLDLVLKAGGVYGWSIGEIDAIPKTYRTYKDGKYVETSTLLSDEIGAFDVDSQDVYSFFTQDMAQYFQCIFVFDFLHMKINAYHPENYGENTNVNINFKNLQQSQDISVDDGKMFTRYYVQGSDDLGITYVNFGSNYIENIDYYLNEKYFSSAFIQKYNLWKQDMENCRIDYIEATRKYNQQMKVITELYDRVPLDDCSTDWSTFTDDELKEAQANYQAQLKGYEQFYVDNDGNFDEDALKKSSDANDYYQIRDVILPSIQIEMDNRQLPTDDDNADYVDSYKTDWKLYGLDELKVKLQEYKNTIETCKKGGYDKPYSEDSSHTKDIHDKMYAKYLDAQNQLDSNYIGGCQEAYDQRQSEIDAANDVLNGYNKTRVQLTKQANKETWVHQNNVSITDENANYITDESNRNISSLSDTISFSTKDLLELSKVYYDGTYSNDNMFLTDSDDQVSAIDEQLKLLDAASDDLYISSHPQYQYTTSLDNFLAKSEYKDYTKNINRGDYLYLTIGNNNVVKLRLIEMTYNPLTMDNNIELTFSNMTRTKNGFSDISYLLDNSSGGSKSSVSGSSNNFLNNEGVTLTSGLIQKLLSSGAFSNKVSSIINNEFAGMLGSGSISLQELNAKLIKVTDLYGENGYFEYLQSKLISADKIVAGIPSSYIATLPSTKKSLVIKVEDSTKKLYDVLTVHILDSLNGVDGQPSISVIITSEKGVVFDDDTTITSTICTCQVYKGATPMEPISYKWQIINNESGDWKTVGNNKTLTINVDKSIIRKRIRCLVDIGDVAQVSITDEHSNTLQDENGISLYSVEAASDTSASSKNIIDVNTTEVLDSSDSVFVNSGKSLKQINYDLLADAILNKLLSKSYEKIGTNVIDAIKENANTLTDKDIDTLIEKM